MGKPKSPILNAPCELKSQFCDGKEVRRVQRIWQENHQMIRGGLFNWCKGCRELMQGGYRYPD
jgi:hypothetical protein